MRTCAERLPGGAFHLIKGSPDPFFVEFLAPGVSKGSGVERMAAYLGVDLQHAVSFGDGDNDRECLECCGVGVAMKNASAMAKAAADVVLDWSNDEDGVALYLEQLEAEGRFQ